MMKDIEIQCDHCGNMIEAQDTYDHQMKRVKKRLDDSMRSVFVRTPDGTTEHAYDFCIKCSDLFVGDMDVRQADHGIATSKERAERIQAAKDADMKRAEERRKAISN